MKLWADLGKELEQMFDECLELMMIRVVSRNDTNKHKYY